MCLFCKIRPRFTFKIVKEVLFAETNISINQSNHMTSVKGVIRSDKAEIIINYKSCVLCRSADVGV